jgi:hypothetical protein
MALQAIKAAFFQLFPVCLPLQSFVVEQILTILPLRLQIGFLTLNCGTFYQILS